MHSMFSFERSQLRRKMLIPSSVERAGEALSKKACFLEENNANSEGILGKSEVNRDALAFTRILLISMDFLAGAGHS